MVGVTLSRWTMSYFALALLSLVGALFLMAVGYGYPSSPVEAPQTLIVVHLVAIGWLSFLLCGALFQFVPVLVAKPLYSNFLPLPTLFCLGSGLLALLLGFLQLAGALNLGVGLLPLGAALLGVGFGLLLFNLGRTLWAARPLILPARFVVTGLCSLVAAAGLGIVFALVLSGVTAEAHVAALTGFALPLHVIAGLAGWLTFTAMGVSYRLLAMFMLAPELDGTVTRATFYIGAAALAVAIIGGLVAICTQMSLTAILTGAGTLGLGTFVLYGRDIIQLYHQRKRRSIELNSKVSAVALANLAVSVILGVLLVAGGALDREIGALLFLASFGWLSGLGLAQLYKIVAFLTWLECYGPVLGRTQTPRVQDLVVEARALKWFVLYFLAVWAGTAALLAGQTTAFQGSAAALLAATVGITTQIVRTRRLLDVNAASRLPQGARRPRLLFSFSDQC
jgi:hypothetical protein